MVGEVWKMMGVLWIFVVTLAMTTDAVHEAKYHQLPRLFDLDDYEWCLSQPRPVFCLGTFHLSPRSEHSPVFDVIQEYSGDQRHFNRTLLHRGYCVSFRCPLTNFASHVSVAANTSSYFEACVQHEMEPYGLRASLQTINFCRSKEEYISTMDMSRLVFLIVIGVIITLNVYGTIYDIRSGEKKSKLWTAWSVHANWQSLTATHDNPRLAALAPIQGARVLMLGLVIMAHSWLVQQRFYLYNPQFYERLQHHPLSMLVLNGTALVQAFVVISNFLLAHSILLSSRTKHYSITSLPRYLRNRIIRLTPVYLLIVGFAATWWRHVGDGPLWDAVVGAESEICRTKFWAHALYINNFVRGDENCMIQTWFIAMDMQLYLVACLVMLLTSRMKRHALPLLGILFIISCIMIAALAYIYDWKAVMYYLTPENARNTYRGVASFSNFYVTPWGNLPACLLGLFVGHLHFAIQEQGYKIAKHTWLMRVCVWSVPLIALWWLSGYIFREQTSRLANTAFLAFERPVFIVLASIYLLGNVNNMDNFQRRLLAWPGFNVMGRLSLSVLMLHWCLNTLVVGSRAVTHASSLSFTADTVTTGFLSYVLAVPLTILVEYPIQKTFT